MEPTQPASPVSPAPQPEDSSRTVSLTDPSSQHYIDRDVLVQRLGEYRVQYAGAKHTLLLAQRVGIEGAHPNQVKVEVDKIAKAIDLTLDLIAKLEEDEDAVIPGPSALEIVSAEVVKA